MSYWPASVPLQCDNGPYSAFVQLRFVGAGKYDNTYVEGVDIDYNRVPSVTYVDTNLKYTLPDSNWAFFFSVNNLFNLKPPLDPGTGNQPRYTQNIFYDVIGRSFRIGAKFKY